ncbi:MAG: BMP family ABC transporter substrate-binding protein [Anaerolineae bacterium]|nr:BMP family ABC transporter substrate-binding protein [Anaerolineae bacterium]
METQDSADYIPNIELFISEGYDIIVTSGEAMTTAMREAGRMYPDVLFIGTDQPQLDEDRNYDPIPNVAGIVFDESVSGFLAGALAASMSESGVIGGVYGTDIITPVVRFRLGYEEGARYINPDVQALGAYHPGTLDQAFVDPQWGAETAKLMIDQGADVIFGAGGQTGNGALIAGCEAWPPRDRRGPGPVHHPARSAGVHHIQRHERPCERRLWADHHGRRRHLRGRRRWLAPQHWRPTTSGRTRFPTR